MAASRHDAGACQARMQAHRGPFPDAPGGSGPYDAVTVGPSEGERAHVGGRSEHRSAALGGTCVRASGGVRGPGGGPGPVDLRACRRRPRGILGGASGPAGLGQALGRRDDLGSALGQVVRRRPAERGLQLPRPTRRGRRRRQGRLLLGGRAGRGAGHHLPGAARRGLPVRERPQGARRPQGRSGRDLPGHGPRAPGRDACLRADRRPALGGVRRVLVRGAPRPHHRCGGQGPDHRGRRLPPRGRRPAQGERRRGPEGVSDDRARRHGPSDRRRARVHRGTGPLVPRPGRGAVDGVRARADGRGGPAVPALHERHHREAQGHRAHDRRVPHAGGGDAPDDLRHPRGRRVLVRRGHRVGHGALVHRVRPAGEPHHERDLRGRAGLAGQGSPLAGRREVPCDDPVHRADRDPGVHAVGTRVPREARPVLVAPARVGR